MREQPFPVLQEIPHDQDIEPKDHQQPDTHGDGGFAPENGLTSLKISMGMKNANSPIASQQAQPSRKIKPAPSTSEKRL